MKELSLNPLAKTVTQIKFFGHQKRNLYENAKETHTQGITTHPPPTHDVILQEMQADNTARQSRREPITRDDYRVLLLRNMRIKSPAAQPTHKERIS